MSKAFASQADLADRKITFAQLSGHCWAYTAEGDPNSGVIIGDKFILVSDATATPAMARDLIDRIRTVSDKPIKYVLLTHYHAVRVLGASAFVAEGATEVIASQGTLELIAERGKQDMQSEMERFPRLFRNAESGRSAGQADSRPGRREGADLAPRQRPHPGRHHRLGGGRKGFVLR
jgi:glyoxylase-like metal-dependent hydrolase (beta-lactamase superfamily II)